MLIVVPQRNHNKILIIMLAMMAMRVDIKIIMAIGKVVMLIIVIIGNKLILIVLIVLIEMIVLIKVNKLLLVKLKNQKLKKLRLGMLRKVKNDLFYILHYYFNIYLFKINLYFRYNFYKFI